MKKYFILVSVFAVIFVSVSLMFVVAAKGQGQLMSQEYRSDVADIVQKLTNIAGRDSKIGVEVRAIAKEQSNAVEKSDEAIKAVEDRSGWKTFFIGTDWKSIGQLRSQLVTTANHINRLMKARDRATSESVKNELDAQIKSLQDTVAKMEVFVKENEGKLSLLGWAVRLFN
ncbi:MAG: hypothetical protein WD989_01230 [Candidatus Paceibacterota bacterium]